MSNYLPLRITKRPKSLLKSKTDSAKILNILSTWIKPLEALNSISALVIKTLLKRLVYAILEDKLQVATMLLMDFSDTKNSSPKLNSLVSYSV
jgi:hypothetical protein